MPNSPTVEPMYLIWSNDTHAWWGPGGNGYRGTDSWQAGRFTRDDAITRCSARTWPSGQRTAPPEVPVLAPENGGAVFTVEQIRAMPRVLAALTDKITVEAMDERSRARNACRWCRSAGEPPTTCTCSYRCGYGGCCSYNSPGRAVFAALTLDDLA